MIKIAELRIGNCLMANGIIQEVTHLKPNLIVFDNSKEKKKAFRLEDVSPVKLTGAILESIGYKDAGVVKVFCFSYEGRFGCYEYDLEDWLNNGKYTFSCNRKSLCEIEYLHQLQNIHYCLTGNELKDAAKPRLRAGIKVTYEKQKS